jgi:16S rRNA (guanine(527)-N(7))-methyltransferase RsmG
VSLSENTLSELLKPFGLEVDSRQLGQVAVYTDLLLRWNKAVNLTAIRRAEEIVTRHFGESMYLATKVKFDGPLLDIGSGAGFPGLALKISLPELHEVLLEPVAKKRAFLKEVVRACELTHVDVLGDRVEEFAAGHESMFKAATVRAVGGLNEILPAAWQALSDHGWLYLWLTGLTARPLADGFAGFNSLFTDSMSIRVPMSRDREIWCGRRRPAAG